MLREMVLAFYLGSGAVMDAFVVAFTLPNLFRRILGEKVLESAVLPSYKQLYQSGNRSAADNLMKTVLLLIVAVGAVITALGMVFAPYLVALFAPGFDPETHRLAVAMSRIMFPFLVMISIAAMFGVILQTREHFGVYGLAPALFNVGVIVFVWWGLKHHGPLIAAWGVLAGIFLETAMMYPVVRKTFRFGRSRVDWNDDSFKKVNRLAVPVLVESILDKTIVLVDRRLASIVSTGSIAALGYAFRLLQLPYGILVLAIARSFYQHLVDTTENVRDFIRMIESAMRCVLALMVPCAAALWIFSEPVVRIVYQRGAFDEVSVQLTASAFACYGIGIVGMTVLAIMTRAFNALKDTRTPVVVAVGMMMINIGLNYVLVRTSLRHAGLALASSIAYSCAGLALFLLMQHKLSKRHGFRVRFHLATASAKIVLATFAAAAAGWAIVRYAGMPPDGLHAVLVFCGGGAVFTLVYGLMLRALGISLKNLLAVD